MNGNEYFFSRHTTKQQQQHNKSARMNPLACVYFSHPFGNSKRKKWKSKKKLQQNKDISSKYILARVILFDNLMFCFIFTVICFETRLSLKAYINKIHTTPRHLKWICKSPYGVAMSI